jgi:hypothetical protein
MRNRSFNWVYFVVFVSMVSSNVANKAFAQKEYRYKNEYSTGDEAQRRFGLPPNHNRNDPKLDAGNFKFELGSKLECGKIDIAANARGQFKELQDQLFGLIPQNAGDAKDLLVRSAFTTMCYAYPTICAQLRNDWLSIQGKLNLRAQACAAVDKFIENQAEKGSRQLKSEAVAKCVQNTVGTRIDPNSEWEGNHDVSTALKFCQKNETGLALRDFQTGMMRSFGNEKQKVLKSILSFAKDETSYDFLSSFLGEIEVGTEGGWVPLFDKGLLRPSDVADTFLTKGQGAVCGNLESILSGRFVSSDVYETEVAKVAKRKLNSQTLADLNDLSNADRQIACLSLGRAIGKEAAQKAASRYESAVSAGLLNTAIPEPLRAEYRERSISAFPAMRQALDGEVIPSVERVRSELSEFARLQRAKTSILASETNRAKLKNTMGDGQSAAECADSLSCE